MKANELIELAQDYFLRIEEMTHRLTTGNVSHQGATIRAYARSAAECLEIELKDISSSDFEYELIEKSIVWLYILEDDSARLTTGNVSHDSRKIRGKAIRSREYLIKHRYDNH